MFLLILFTFLLGILTVFSESMLSIISQLKTSPDLRSNKNKAMMIAVSFVGSFILSFWIVTLFINIVGIQTNVFRYMAILLIAFYGFVLILPTFTSLFARLVDKIVLNPSNSISINYSGILLGFLWGPLTWIFLAPLSFFVVTIYTTLFSLILALTYALGVVFSLFNFLSSPISNSLIAIQMGERLRQIVGLGMIVVAIVLAFNWNTFFGRAVLHDLPDIQLEDQPFNTFDVKSPKFPDLSIHPFSQNLVQTSVDITPDIYLGYARKDSLMQLPQLIPNLTYSYHDFFEAMGFNRLVLRGKWEAYEQYILSQSSQSELKINFQADHVYALLGGTSSDPIQLIVDGKPLKSEYYTTDLSENGEVLVNQNRLYKLLDFKGKLERHDLVLIVPQGIKVYAFTFGGHTAK